MRSRPDLMRWRVQDKTKEATFLLVDDDQISIMAMKRALKKLKIVNKTLEAKDGQEALDILRAAADKATGKLPPFIVTLDLNMPRMNGLDFIEAARREPEGKALPMLLLTTETAQALKDRAKAVRATGWLTKPFDPKQILSLVDQLAQ